VFRNRVLRKIFYSKSVGVMRDWRIHIMGNFKKYKSHHIYSDDQGKENEMGGACSMYGRKEKCGRGFGGEI